MLVLSRHVNEGITVTDDEKNTVGLTDGNRQTVS